MLARRLNDYDGPTADFREKDNDAECDGEENTADDERTLSVHAKIAFWITEKTVEAVNGRPYFSKSTSPPQIEYEVENGATDLELSACDDDVFPVIDRTPKHTIRFHNTPRSVLACLHTALGPILKEKLMFGLPSLALGFLGVIAPVLFAYFDPLDPKAKYYLVLE